MHRIIATSLTILLLGAPVVGAATIDDADTYTDADTVLVPPGHVAVADAVVTEDGVDLQMSTAAEDALTPVALQTEEAERPNCLTGEEGWSSLSSGVLNVAGEAYAPLVEAGAAEKCAGGSFDDGFDSATFVTSADGQSKLRAAFSAGFIFNLFTIACEGTDLATGSPGDVQSVGCEAKLQGPATDTSSWVGWTGEIYRDDANGASYGTFTSE